jgi:hypothetical protein
MKTEQQRKAAIVSALETFIRSRPGLEYANYGCLSAYRSEARSITRDKRDAETLLDAVRYQDTITADCLIAAARGAYSGRLSIVEREDGEVAINYCTGQYYPTEYRRAACAVLASALWAARRDRMPAPSAWRAEGAKAWNGNKFTGPMCPWRESKEAAQSDLDAMPASEHGYRGSIREGYGPRKLTAADWLRESLRNDFGRALANRWFA